MGNSILVALDWSSIFLIASIIGCGQFIYAAIGFGAGLFSISILGLIFGDVSFFVPFFLILCLPVEIFVTFKDRKKILARQSWPILLVSLPFILFGSFFLKKASDTYLLLMMGLVVMAMALLTWSNPTILIPKRFHAMSSWFAGAIGGFLGSVFGMGGPPLVLYFKALGLAKSEFRVALTSVFLAMGLSRAFIYSAMGLYSLSMLRLMLICFPFVLLGLFLGDLAHARLSERIFKKVTSAILMLSGLLLVIKNI